MTLSGIDFVDSITVARYKALHTTTLYHEINRHKTPIQENVHVTWRRFSALSELLIVSSNEHISFSQAKDAELPLETRSRPKITLSGRYQSTFAVIDQCLAPRNTATSELQR